ncbi:MAG: class I SAM-dependent methyltransferase, partial [Pseudomonadota bacterium]
MSDQDRVKWDKRYAEGAYAGRDHPSALLAERLSELPLPPRGERPRALDVACGAGRNSLYLARHGFRVDAIDIAANGLQRGRERAERDGLSDHISWYCQDLFADSHYPHTGYALIVVFRFVANPILPDLGRLLAPGGILMVESHLHWPDPQVVLSGPQTPAFRVKSGQLRECVAPLEGFDILLDEEGLVEEPDG